MVFQNLKENLKKVFMKIKSIKFSDFKIILNKFLVLFKKFFLFLFKLNVKLNIQLVHFFVANKFAYFFYMF